MSVKWKVAVPVGRSGTGARLPNGPDLAAGPICFRGTEITRTGSHRFNQVGIGGTFQRTRLFCKMTAFENVLVVARGGPGVARRRADESLDLVSR